MSSCECGCGGKPTNGSFLPGHDQKLRGDLERRVGGLLALRDIVIASEEYSAGMLSVHPFSDRVRAAFARRTQAGA